VVASSTAFPRACRLLAGSDFSRVFAGADRSSDRFFTVLSRLNDVAAARLGLAIARRAAALAVDRNRLKRLARESFRQLELLPLAFVVMAKREAVSAPNPSLRSSLDRHFLRLSRRAAGG
jgi:ribonuclease P protein component